MKTHNDSKSFCTKTPWLPLGLGAGIALGVALNQLALWMALGLLFGLAMNARARRH